MAIAFVLTLPIASGGAAAPRPALARVTVVVTTASSVLDLVLDTGTIVNAMAPSNGAAVQVRVAGNHIQFRHDDGGEAEGAIRILVAGVDPGTPVRWHVAGSGSPPARIEIYNVNNAARARLVDRFTADAAQSTFATPAEALLDGGPVTISAGPVPLVLAFFYPWYQHFNWASDRLQDRPLYEYSTELSDEVGHTLDLVRRAGLDGVIVSWGGDTDWNDRRLRIVLDQAQTLGLKVSVLVETLGATEGPAGTVKPLVPDKMRVWLEKAFDRYAAYPAFLKARGRPVVFVYAADSFTLDNWRVIVQSLNDTGRQMLLIADAMDPAFLEPFGGAFRYAIAPVPQRELNPFDSDQTLRTATHNLLFGGDRRIAATTVSPGYDDSRLQRDTTLVVDRHMGMVYDTEWQAALSAQPDWVLVTSWNEFWENTHIEPSVRYGYQYSDRTRVWTGIFHQRAADRLPRAPQ